MRTKNTILDRLLFVTESDYQCMLSHLYHENSKAGRKKYELDSNAGGMEAMEHLSKMVSGKGKDYSFHKSIDINDIKLIEQQRRSTRNFNNTHPVSKKILDTILRPLLAFPIDNHNFRRGYPSAGALYPVEIYPIVFNVDECEPGLYYLDAYKHKLMQLR